MENKQNLHTHSTYCDGRDTPEEMVLAAMEKGFSSIGFSGHCHMPYSLVNGGKPDVTDAYRQEISRLKQVYADQIDIFCGLEVDSLADVDMEGYDYLLGAVHYFKFGEEIVGFDRSKEVVAQVLDKYFDGSGMKFAQRFYSDLAQLPKFGNFDILAHFDILSKNVESLHMFDEEDPKYLALGYEAIDALAGKIPFFEVNTGGMSRGFRTRPYPIPAFVRYLREKGFKATISSDCHDARYLDHGFEDARELLRSCGFQERYVLTKTGFTAVPL